MKTKRAFRMYFIAVAVFSNGSRYSEAYRRKIAGVDQLHRS